MPTPPRNRSRPATGLRPARDTTAPAEQSAATGINVGIARYFLNKPRTTLLAFATLVFLGIASLAALTTLISLAPLAIFAPDYRSLAIVVMFGLLTGGILSLVVSPILYLFFNAFSEKVTRVVGRIIRRKTS